MKRWGFFIASVMLLVAWCAFIFAMSHKPADESTELSMGVVWHIIGFIVPGYDQMSPADQLYWQSALEHPVRKIAHFLEFALLGALTLNAFWQGLRTRQSMRDESQVASADRNEGKSVVPTPRSEGNTMTPTAFKESNTIARTSCDGSQVAASAPTENHTAPNKKLIVAAAWAFATLYAATDEFHQIFVPGRTGRVTDVLLDSAGALVGVLLMAIVLRAIERRRSRE